jgi:hypothetical protein
MENPEDIIRAKREPKRRKSPKRAIVKPEDLWNILQTNLEMEGTINDLMLEYFQVIEKSSIRSGVLAFETLKEVLFFIKNFFREDHRPFELINQEIIIIEDEGVERGQAATGINGQKFRRISPKQDGFQKDLILSDIFQEMLILTLNLQRAYESKNSNGFSEKVNMQMLDLKVEIFKETGENIKADPILAKEYMNYIRSTNVRLMSQREQIRKLKIEILESRKALEIIQGDSNFLARKVKLEELQIDLLTKFGQETIGHIGRLLSERYNDRKELFNDTFDKKPKWFKKLTKKYQSIITGDAFGIHSAIYADMINLGIIKPGRPKSDKT